MSQCHPNHSSAFCKEHKTKAILVVIALAFSSLAHAQTWEYQSYPDGENILRSPDKPLAPGYITLNESGEKPIFTMFAGNVTKCFAGSIEAKVNKTIDTTMITVRRDLKGCGSARFVIKNDGTGGRREILRDGKWIWDGLERGMSLKK